MRVWLIKLINLWKKKFSMVFIPCWWCLYVVAYCLPFSIFRSLDLIIMLVLIYSVGLFCFNIPLCGIGLFCFFIRQKLKPSKICRVIHNTFTLNISIINNYKCILETSKCSFVLLFIKWIESFHNVLIICISRDYRMFRKYLLQKKCFLKRLLLLWILFLFLY